MRTFSDCLSFVHFFTVKKLAAHIPVINVAILYLSSVLFVHSFRSPSSEHITHTHTLAVWLYEPDVLPIISHRTGIPCMSICRLSIIQTVVINFSHKVVYYLGTGYHSRLLGRYPPGNCEKKNNPSKLVQRITIILINIVSQIIKVEKL